MIQMKVVSISSVTDGYATVVLTSNLMNPDIALLRKEKVKIIVDKFEGYKIPRAALRSAENNGETAEISDGKKLGVYILYGQMVKFRYIDVLSFSDDYVIAAKDSENSDALKLYDLIITKGRNLYDGKIIS